MNTSTHHTAIRRHTTDKRVTAADRALEAELNHFKSLLINTTTGILMVSSDRVIMEVNPRFCEMYGYAEHELLGQSAEILHLDHERYEAFGIWFRKALLENGPLVQTEYQYRRKDGSLFWGLISGIRAQLQDQTNGVLWSLHDITDRKMAEQALLESELKFRTMADHTYDWEYWRAQDGSIIYVTPSCERITGYKAEEFLQNPELLTRILHPDDRKRFALHLGSEQDNTVTTDCQTPDFRIITKSGEERWITHVCLEVFDPEGSSLGRRASNRDITNRKRVEENLRETNRRLEDANQEMGMINQELEQRRNEAEEAQLALQAARDAAEAATRSKSEFLANMSHEIRTPLNAIIGFSTLALKSGLLPHQQEYVGKIHTAGELMLNLINDILDFSKIEAGKLKMEQVPFRLDTIIANVLSIMEQKALDKGLRIQCCNTMPEASIHLKGDPHRLVQILVNLLSNAIKFTEQGEVSLDLALLAQEDERLQLQFAVRDTGIGISDEQRARLFQPFTQADGSTTRRFGGTGLGLSISRQLVELMGGNIWCDSSPGQGSCFSFTAWFGTAAPGDTDVSLDTTSTGLRAAEQAADFSSSCILLVEDNEMNQQLAMELLKDTGATVHLATNGREAVDIVTSAATAYDLVLMDIQMPVMDGFEATRLIRADSRFATLPIIAMTANVLQDDLQQIRESGMDTRIAKPIDLQAMLLTMSPFLTPQHPGERRAEPAAEVSEETPAIPAITGIDVDTALGRLGGDRKLYLWLLHSFIENKADTALAIQTALQAGDTPLAARYAHTVKGLAGNIGALELEQLARNLEANITGNRQATEDEICLTPFAAALNRLITDLRLLLPQAALQPDEPARTGMAAPLTQELTQCNKDKL